MTKKVYREPNVEEYPVLLDEAILIGSTTGEDIVVDSEFDPW